MSSFSSEKKTLEAPSQKQLTIGALCDAYEALATLWNEKFDFQNSARILTLCKWIEPLYTDTMEERNRIVKRLGTPLDPPEEGKYRISDEVMPQYKEEVMKVIGEMVTVPQSYKLKSTEFDGVKISPTILMRINGLLANPPVTSTN